jgi:hypothetical protein
MKTAVEWLESEMLEHYSPFDNKLLYEAIHKAKEMEKEQIKTAYLNGNAFGIDIENGLSPSHYYNVTFKQQEQ